MKIILVFLLFTIAGFAQEESKEKSNFSERMKSKEMQKKLELRDPFRRSLPKSKKKSTRAKGFYRDGKYTNVNEINDVPLGKIKIIGVLLGKKRRAIAKIDGGDDSGTYILKEGMKLGVNKAIIKAILPGGIVLVEKIKNVYDQDEYIETIMPVIEQ